MSHWPAGQKKMMDRVTVVPEPGSPYYRVEVKGAFIGGDRSYMTSVRYLPEVGGKKPPTHKQVESKFKREFPKCQVTVETVPKPKHPALP